MSSDAEQLKQQRAHEKEVELIRAASGIVCSSATGDVVESAQQFLVKKLKEG